MKNIGKQISQKHLASDEEATSATDFQYNAKTTDEQKKRDTTPTHNCVHVAACVPMSNRHSDKLAHKSKYVAAGNQGLETPNSTYTNVNLIKTFFSVLLLIPSFERSTKTEKNKFGRKSRESK